MRKHFWLRQRPEIFFGDLWDPFEPEKPLSQLIWSLLVFRSNLKHPNIPVGVKHVLYAFSQILFKFGHTSFLIQNFIFFVGKYPRMCTVTFMGGSVEPIGFFLLKWLYHAQGGLIPLLLQIACGWKASKNGWKIRNIP